MIGFDDALALVIDAARPLEQETVALDDAAGRTLAEAVVAHVDSPPADVSAMDGYAVREADLDRGQPLRLIGASYPGAGFEGGVGPGACVRIFTGAPVPRGVDRVVVQEIVTRDDDWIRIKGAPSKGRHIRTQGSDFGVGDRLLLPGRMLDARGLVAAAAADLARLVVWRRPRVTILGTGDELVAPGDARIRPGSIPESVSFGVAALAEQWGGQVIGRHRLRDDSDVMRVAAAEALAASDLVVMTGGASVGEKDFAKSVFHSLGVELLFSKVAIKPGKPVWLGRSEGRLVLGLPGNPTSSLVTARLFLAPLVAGLAGRKPANAVGWIAAPLAGSLPPCGDRETFVRGRWMGHQVQALVNQDSSAQHALAEADLLIRRRAGAPAAEVGDRVDVIAF